MTLTKESVDIESLLQDSLPCETSYNDCMNEAVFLIRKTYCNCCAFKCARHTQEWIEKLNDWHNRVYGTSINGRCGECRIYFVIPTNPSDCYIVIPI